MLSDNLDFLEKKLKDNEQNILQNDPISIDEIKKIIDDMKSVNSELKSIDKSSLEIFLLYSKYLSFYEKLTKTNPVFTNLDNFLLKLVDETSKLLNKDNNIIAKFVHKNKSNINRAFLIKIYSHIFQNIKPHLKNIILNDIEELKTHTLTQQLINEHSFRKDVLPLETADYTFVQKQTMRNNFYPYGVFEKEETFGWLTNSGEKFKFKDLEEEYTSYAIIYKNIRSNISYNIQPVIGKQYDTFDENFKEINISPDEGISDKYIDKFSTIYKIPIDKNNKEDVVFGKMNNSVSNIYLFETYDSVHFRLLLCNTRKPGSYFNPIIEVNKMIEKAQSQYTLYHLIMEQYILSECFNQEIKNIVKSLENNRRQDTNTIKNHIIYKFSKEKGKLTDKKIKNILEQALIEITNRDEEITAEKKITNIPKIYAAVNIFIKKYKNAPAVNDKIKYVVIGMDKEPSVWRSFSAGIKNSY